MAGEGLEIVVEMHRFIWQRFESALADLSPPEIDWRPLPEANNINAIVRHLRIEAEWHVASLERGEAMPLTPSEERQRKIDAVPFDYAMNLRELEAAYKRFVVLLENSTVETVRRRAIEAYREWQGERPADLLGFQQAGHLASHLGQIRSIRNLYRKTRGEEARFFFAESHAPRKMIQAARTPPRQHQRTAPFG